MAQWLELTAHNRLVPGSSPGGPTNEINSLALNIAPLGSEYDLDMIYQASKKGADRWAAPR